MPNDNPAKSYIETVLARADGAIPGKWERHVYPSGTITVAAPASKGWIHICHPKRMVPVPGKAGEFTGVWDDDKTTDAKLQRLKNADFIAASRQDIPTLAKMLLRAIEALEFITEESDCDREADDRVKDACWAALADINDMAKGSQ